MYSQWPPSEVQKLVCVLQKVHTTVHTTVLLAFVSSCQDGGCVQRHRPPQEDHEEGGADDAAPTVGHDPPSVDRQAWRQVAVTHRALPEEGSGPLVGRHALVPPILIGQTIAGVTIMRKKDSYYIIFGASWLICNPICRQINTYFF